MTDRVVAALIIGASIIVGAALWGGRYSTSPVMTGQVGGGGVYVVDAFSGRRVPVILHSAETYRTRSGSKQGSSMNS